MYRPTVTALSERKHLIQEAVNARNDTHPFYEYKNRRFDLPIACVEIGSLVYRMANYRTRTAQLKYIHENDKSSNFFDLGQENDDAQQAQHWLLVDLAYRGRAESVVPIIDELRAGEQREPLLITSSGVVVNGNRRLAAMRELFAEDPGLNRRYGHVDCAVLPGDVTPVEIQEIEVRLQMRPETKLPYGWVNESLAIRDLVNGGMKVEHVADLMNKKKREVERASQALTEADIYLKERLDAPGEYQHVEDAEQFFNDLAKALEGKTGEELEVSRRVAWILLSNSKSLDRRVYDYNFSFGKRTEEVTSKLADRCDIDLMSTPTINEESPTDELEVDLDTEDGGSRSLQPLIDFLDDEIEREYAEQQVVNVCNTILEQDKQGQVARRALSNVQAANGKLEEVDLVSADPSTYSSIDLQLDSVITRATRLKDKLASYTRDGTE